MKTISAGLTTALAQEVTTKAHCWRITRRDNVVFYFTDHDEDLSISDGNSPPTYHTYVSAVGYQETAISSDAALSVNSLEVSGYFDSAALTADDLRSGLFDFAEARVFVVDWSDLTLNEMKLARCYLGEVRSTPAGIFTTELRGMAQRLQAKVADVYTPECRADFGSVGLRQCNKDPVPFTNHETVTAVTDAAHFVITNGDTRAVDAWYAYGVVTWTAGANNGRSMEVKGWDQSDAAVELILPMHGTVTIGDTLDIVAGCDKRHDTCKDKFDNMVNRQAEDFIPGVDAVIQTPNSAPSAKSGKK